MAHDRQYEHPAVVAGVAVLARRRPAEEPHLRLGVDPQYRDRSIRNDPQ